jgi:hypothetical protein
LLPYGVWQTTRSFLELETIQAGEKSEYTPDVTPAKKGGKAV